MQLAYVVQRVLQSFRCAAKCFSSVYPTSLEAHWAPFPTFVRTACVSFFHCTMVSKAFAKLSRVFSSTKKSTCIFTALACNASIFLIIGSKSNKALLDMVSIFLWSFWANFSCSFSCLLISRLSLWPRCFLGTCTPASRIGNGYPMRQH